MALLGVSLMLRSVSLAFFVSSRYHLRSHLGFFEASRAGLDAAGVRETHFHGELLAVFGLLLLIFEVLQRLDEQLLVRGSFFLDLEVRLGCGGDGVAGGVVCFVVVEDDQTAVDRPLAGEDVVDEAGLGVNGRAGWLGC